MAFRQFSALLRLLLLLLIKLSKAPGAAVTSSARRFLCCWRLWCRSFCCHCTWNGPGVHLVQCGGLVQGLVCAVLCNRVGGRVFRPWSQQVRKCAACAGLLSVPSGGHEGSFSNAGAAPLASKSKQSAKLTYKTNGNSWWSSQRCVVRWCL